MLKLESPEIRMALSLPRAPDPSALAAYWAEYEDLCRQINSTNEDEENHYEAAGKAIRSLEKLRPCVSRTVSVCNLQLELKGLLDGKWLPSPMDIYKKMRCCSLKGDWNMATNAGT